MPKCSKCGSEDITVKDYVKAKPCYCNRCTCYWVPWQQSKIEELERQVGEARDLFNDFFDDETSVTTAPLMLGMKRFLADTEPKES